MSTITSMLDKIMGTKSDRFIKEYTPLINKINNLESHLNKMSKEDIHNYLKNIKESIHKTGNAEEYMGEIFAAIREAAIRTIGHRHYDVQLLGGIALCKGYISEMGTGEGKTLVATLPVIYRALQGPVHMVTVNDYLAERDLKLMSKIYDYLGFSSGFITQNTPDHEQINIFSTKDIVYISNNQIVFHYLRHLLRHSNKAGSIDRKFIQYAAIVDEVDNILIDEARTPFIISAEVEEDVTNLYIKINEYIPLLEENKDFLVMFKSHNVLLTDEGIEVIENLLITNGIIEDNLFVAENNHILHIVRNLLKAHHLFRKDIEYAVLNNEIIIIDESTGRLSYGRRFSKGLHQALEAKENLEIQGENETLLSITYTSFFKEYDNLCGMTGTASTEKEEFLETYKMEIIKIPPNRPKIRKDHEVQLFETREKQLKYTINLIKEKYTTKQPILLVTTNVQESEVISYLLNKDHIPHQLLNAKNHAQEASFVANAGTAGAITIATNMAGRGTDIKLGGNTDFQIEEMLLKSNDMNENIHEELTPEQIIEEESLSDIKYEEMNLTLQQKKKIKQILEDAKPAKDLVKSAGGLCVIIFGLPESEKILLQAIGRSGRQGDPGESYSLFSLDDDILKTGLQGSFNKYIFSKIFEGEDFVSGEIVYNTIVKKLWAMLGANHFKSRKDLNKYEEIRNQQRQDFFLYRDMVLKTEDPIILIEQCFYIFINEDFNTYDINYINKKFNLNIKSQEIDDINFDEVKYKNTIKETLINNFKNIKNKNFDKEYLRNLILKHLDHIWKRNINEVESIQYGSNLVAYAQKDPLHEFNIQASNTFQKSIINYRFLLLIDIMNQDDNIINIDNIFNENIPNKENIHLKIEELLKKFKDMDINQNDIPEKDIDVNTNNISSEDNNHIKNE